MRKVSLLLVSLCLVYPSMAAAQLCGDPFRSGNMPDISEITTCFGIEECVTVPNTDYNPSLFQNKEGENGDSELIPSKVDVKNVFSK